MPMKITSPAFIEGGSIPTKYTCEGEDISPMLAWTGAPKGTRSFVLIVDDPDAPDPAAPKMTYVHWILFNIPGHIGGLPEGMTEDKVPPEVMQGLNDWRRTGYGGPCPPIGRHRYFFRLYALDTVLPEMVRPIRAQIDKAMEGHVLEEASYMGTYQKKHGVEG